MNSIPSKPQTAFISYAWDSDIHKSWVRDFATRLRGYGIETILDQWHTAPGDQLPAFMERAVRENNYVLIVCTPKYKMKSDSRQGGVGYEGDIMTAEVVTTGNHRKFIPILRSGDWKDSAPSWLQGKYRIDLRNDPYSEDQFNDLLITIRDERPKPPALGTTPLPVPKTLSRNTGTSPSAPASDPAFVPIRIEGIVVDEVTQPRNDGSRGSALYTVPFKLDQVPPALWSRFFIEEWDHPASFTTSHRPGIADVSGDRIILEGTTIDEVNQTHRETLRLALKAANSRYSQREAEQQRLRQSEDEEREKHAQKVREAAAKFRIDD